MPIRPGMISSAALALAALAGAVSVQAGDQPQRLLLQQVTPHSAIIKWRGGDATRVCYSTKLSDLAKKNWPRCVDGALTEGNHREAWLTGLAPDQIYYYALGSLAGEEQRFQTPPNSNKPPKDGNTHILIVGDSGTETERSLSGTPTHPGEAAQVLAGFKAYNAKAKPAGGGDEPVDLFLLLGDNAYNAGTDAEWQGSFFAIYPDILESTAVLPTIGNHEMGYGLIDYGSFDPRIPRGVYAVEGTSVSADPLSYDGTRLFAVPADGSGPPYLTIFSLPANGESGGVPSGTEQYYSVDYGNVHVVSLDSQLSARDPDQLLQMKNWLRDDLANNGRDWTVVIFHHPPYSKGANHDSDDAGSSVVDVPQRDMRVEFTPIFEEYGVDVVYSGHSHSYERSYYLRGLTGISDTFAPMSGQAELANAEPALGYGEQTYQQLSPTSGGLDDRVVYTVAGNSGKADSNSGFAPFTNTTPAEWLRHPAHVPQPKDTLCTPDPDDGFTGCRNGLAKIGSVVLDASANRLSSRLIDVSGNVLDEFIIER